MKGCWAWVSLLLVSIAYWPLSHGFSIAQRSTPVTRHNERRAASSTRLNLMILPSHVEQLCNTYTYCLVEHQLATQSATAGLFAGLGDILAQTVSEDQETRKPYDPRRTAHFVLKGLGGGIMWNAWFELSDPLSLSLAERFLGSTSDATSGTTMAAVTAVIDPMVLLQAMRVAICIVLEQCFVSPLFYTLWDIPIPALLSGTPVRHVPAQISSKLGPLLIANAKVWTPANLITYNLPTEFRVLFASCADLVWQVLCSKITTSQVEVTPSSTLSPFALDDVPRAAASTVCSSAATESSTPRVARVSSTQLRAMSVLRAANVPESSSASDVTPFQPVLSSKLESQLVR